MAMVTMITIVAMIAHHRYLVLCVCVFVPPTSQAARREGLGGSPPGYNGRVHKDLDDNNDNNNGRAVP